jgi:hypothetical protein
MRKISAKIQKCTSKQIKMFKFIINIATTFDVVPNNLLRHIMAKQINANISQNQLCLIIVINATTYTYVHYPKRLNRDFAFSLGNANLLPFRSLIAKFLLFACEFFDFRFAAFGMTENNALCFFSRQCLFCMLRNEVALNFGRQTEGKFWLIITLS